jgi:murein DD-endopeptidase MepM/ murein hydrolase activator NlpD
MGKIGKLILLCGVIFGLTAEEPFLGRRLDPPQPAKLNRPAFPSLEDSVRINRLQAALDSLKTLGGPEVELNWFENHFLYLFKDNESFQEIWLERSEFKQGDHIRLRLFAKLPLENPRLRFLKYSYPLYLMDTRPNRISYQTYLAVAMRADTGIQVITLFHERKGSLDSLKLPVRILLGDFAHRVRKIKEIEVTEETRQKLIAEHSFFNQALSMTLGNLVPDSIFAWPASGMLTSEFGVGSEFEGLETGWAHKGLDIGNEAGVPIYAAANGIVTGADSLEAHGKSVVIAHGQGIHTGYLHLSEILVEKGKRVRKGELIGRMGATGVATGPNLHFQVWVKGIPVNPRGFLPQGHELPMGEWVERRKLNR